MAQETQYCSLRYILGTVYSGKTEASEISPADCQRIVHSKRFPFLLAPFSVVLVFVERLYTEVESQKVVR